MNNANMWNSMGGLPDLATKAARNVQKNMWTALPAIVTAVNAKAMTCDVQPAIKGRHQQEDGSVSVHDLPLLLDCPIVFPHAGGCSLTFPIKAGDEVLAVFASRGIDLWWAWGNTQPPPEARMHDLSDGFVIAGVWSQPNALPDMSTSQVELRTDDGQAKIAIHPTSHQITIQTSGNIVQTISGNVTQTVKGSVTETVSGTKTVTASKVKFTCPVEMSKTLNVTGEITGSGITYSTHTHSGVETGTKNTGTPNT